MVRLSRYFLAGIFLIIPQYSYATLEEMPVHISCKPDLTVNQCLDTVAQSLGIVIHCQRCSIKKAFLKKDYTGSLYDVLHQITENANMPNCSIIFDDTRHSVSINQLISDEAEDLPQAEGTGRTGNSVFPQGNMTDTPASQSTALEDKPVSSLDTVILPPSNPGQKGITLREARQLQEQSVLKYAQTDPLDVEVIPPIQDGENGLKFRDVQKIQNLSQQENTKIDPLDVEVLPPTKDGGKGLKLRDIQKMQNSSPQANTKIDPLDVEVFPPTKSGENGSTLRELQKTQTKSLSTSSPTNVSPRSVK